MSTDRKVMKVVALCLLAWAIVMIVLDVMAIMAAVGEGFGPGDLIWVVLLTFLGIFGFWVGMAGVRGANTPSRSGRFNAGALILGLVCLVDGVLTFATGNGIAATIAGPEAQGDMVNLCLSVVGFVLCAIGWFEGRRVLEASKK